MALIEKLRHLVCRKVRKTQILSLSDRRHPRVQGQSCRKLFKVQLLLTKVFISVLVAKLQLNDGRDSLSTQGGTALKDTSIAELCW